MIARLRLLLPYDIYIPDGSTFKPTKMHIEDLGVTFYPPATPRIARAQAAELQINSSKLLFEQLQPDVPEFLPWLLLDGSQCARTSLLQIDFERSNFDRTSSTDQTVKSDPPVDTVFGIANRFLGCLRSITQDPTLRTISPATTSWTIEYLEDNGNPVAYDPTDKTHQQIGYTTGEGPTTFLTPDLFERAMNLVPTYVSEPWDVLILDAKALYPEAAAAVVLASAAVESFIAHALDRLAAKSTIPPKLWQWLTNRNHFLQNPSVSDQLDILLEVVSGRSLKEDKLLWEDFAELRKIRNSLAHEGRLLAGKAKSPSSVDRVFVLVDSAFQIILRVEQLLPAEERRPIMDISGTVTIRLSTDDEPGTRSIIDFKER